MVDVNDTPIQRANILHNWSTSGERGSPIPIYLPFYPSTLRKSRGLPNVDQLYEVDMKPLRYLRDEAPSNASDLIAHLRKLYEAMNSDPAFAASAEHIRNAVLELEQTRRLAWEVYREEQAAQRSKPLRRSKKRGKKAAESPTDWLRDVPPASPLKQ